MRQDEVEAMYSLIASHAEKHQAQFLVSGSIALGYWEIPSDAKGIEIGIPAERFDQWRQIAEEMGYAVFSYRNSTVKVTAQPNTLTPIVMHLVEDGCFAKMFERSEVVTLNQTRLHIPTLEDLLAITLAAIWNRNKRRGGSPTVGQIVHWFTAPPHPVLQHHTA